MKSWNYASIARKPAGVLVLILSLACGILRGQEPAATARPTSGGANPPGDQSHFLNGLIRDRMRDYESILDGEYRERIVKWDELFLSTRQSGMTSAVQEIVVSANRIRKTRGLDATQLKDDAEFHQILSKQITGVLNADGMKVELATWAKDIELVTRTRMIECFQQIIAEDLGRTFDENLSNQVVKAVRAIPIEVLVAEAGSSGQIEQAILASLPKSALSETARKTISTSASVLARGAVFVWAGAHGMPKVAPLLAVAAGEAMQFAADAALLELNEQITKKPDTNLIRSHFERALRDWNVKTLDPRLESILTDFRRLVIQHVEDQARKESQNLRP